MTQIDYYFSVLSPNVYLAGEQFEEVAKEHGAEVTYKPLDLMGLFARTGGVPPKDRHVSRQEYRLQEMRRKAKKVGAKLNLKPLHWPTNAAPASYAVIAAQNAGGGNLGKLVKTLTGNVWADEKNIAEDEVIAEALESSGFDPALANAGLLQGAEIYARNLEDAVEAGVFGAPFYIVKDTDERFWGQDRIEDLGRYLAGGF